MTNTEQGDLWNGPTGDFWTAHADRLDRMLGVLTPHLMRGAALTAADRVLDIGCGCGATTREAAARAASAHGVDLSAPMVAHARRLAADLHTVTFERTDAQTHPFGTYDIAISRLGVMFFDDPVAAFANLRRAVGRLAFVSWQGPDKNEYGGVKRAALAPHIPMPPPPTTGPGPFSLADPAQVETLLTGAGFGEVTFTDIREPLMVGATADETTDFMLSDPQMRTQLAEAGEPTATRARAALREAYASFETPQGVRLNSAAWLVTAT